MDIMDIQAVESKLSDVTVTPIPRSQVQNFYNYQQREQREQQPQIQISAIHHTPRDRHHSDRGDSSTSGHSSSRDLYTSTSKRERDYHQQLSNVAAAVAGGGTSAAVAAAALQYTQQLQAQLALLQQQANTTASPSITLTPAGPAARSAAHSNSISHSNHHQHHHHSSNSNNNNNNNSGTSSSMNLNGSHQHQQQQQHTQSQLKYPQSSSPVALLAAQSSLNLSSANLPSSSGGVGGLNNGLTKYAQLLAIIEEMGRDIRPTYTGSRTSTERLKRGIVHARILVRECLMETERSARQ
ncbi:nuclear transcription factor Y subunit gamma [Stomoxys calcitrans]|uniref:Cyclin-dependent kinase 2-associated protein n=1 Tax=Stomoxys calcitrans TaxID=35570 RepID=A0A1I8PSV3_STOCA|nr:nuclear transcription factor Y subunit gamma [Stomoxys calcitrans]